MDYKWKPFDELPATPEILTDGELESLSLVWADQRESLEGTSEFADFLLKLKREWAIETGQIERVYTLERGITETLIEHGIEAGRITRLIQGPGPERTAAIIADQFAVLEELFSFVKGERELTVGYIKELHAALTRNQETHEVKDQTGQWFDKPLPHGLYKVHPNSPRREDDSIHEYCPPEHVAAEMDRLVTLAREYDSRSIRVEVQAAWLHHRFTQIHPFEDGNGRVARCLATLVFLKRGLFPVIVRQEQNSDYISALEKADYGNLVPLVSFFSSIQRQITLQAIDVVFGVREPKTVEDEVKRIGEVLRIKRRGTRPEWERVKVITKHLMQHTFSRLSEVSLNLQRETGASGMQFPMKILSGYMGDDVANATQVANAFGLSVAAEHLAHHVSLLMQAEPLSKLVVCAAGVGPKPRGLEGLIVYFESASRKPEPAIRDFFLVNYRETEEKTLHRFQLWLEEAIRNGLAAWRKTL